MNTVALDCANSTQLLLPPALALLFRHVNPARSTSTMVARFRSPTAPSSARLA
jgi:hypothetical protein